MPDVVARHVLPVFGKVGGEAEVRRTVKARDEPFDDEPRDELEVVDARQDLGIQEPSSGDSLVASWLLRWLVRSRSLGRVREGRERVRRVRVGLSTLCTLRTLCTLDPGLRHRNSVQQLINDLVGRDAF